MLKLPWRAQKQNKALQTIQKRVFIHAGIAFWTIIVTIALIFGMSAAWYTNVLQTSGLQFQAEAWGFNGEVTVADTAIEAGPGDTGVVGLTVTNSSEDLLYVTVNLSKAQMSVPMQQRLYFYVDVETESNGEHTDRVYINTQKNYTYSLLSHSNLVLTEERSNDVLLKWQWVYDMEGYYFLGSVTETANAEGAVAVVSNVEDYLRPVEYDLDTAVFRDGALVEANGKPLDQFMEDLSSSDGYAGDITSTEWPGYYKVDVDENGYGVWVYICNWAEIQQATTFDTELGKAAANAIQNGAERDSYVARLTFTGQAVHSEFTEVTTISQLQEALNEGGLIKLTHSLELTDTLVIAGGEKAVLDLAGCKVTAPNGKPALELKDGSDITVINGELVGSNIKQDVITVAGSNLTLSQITISGDCDDAIYVVDQSSTVDSCVRLFDCDITASSCAVYMRGNGSSADGYTQVIIENSRLTSDYMTITGNGTPSYWGTDVQVYRSILKGKYAAIYQPQGDSITRVTESTLSGITGIVIKSGDLVVANSTVMGTGTVDQIQAPAIDNSGFSDTGDGIYIECGYKNVMNITISGESTVVTSNSSQAIRVYEPDSVYANVELLGGMYSTDVSSWLSEGYKYDQTTGMVLPTGEAANE